LGLGTLSSLQLLVPSMWTTDANRAKGGATEGATIASARDGYDDSMHRLTFPSDVDRPVWENSTDEADAVRRLASGTWLPGSEHRASAYANYSSDRGPKFLNEEERKFLEWTENITSRMTVKNASTRVAFELWNQDFVSLYNTSKTIKVANGQYYCRMSWGFHWCDPLHHGFEYHSRHWSAARGIELLESFVRLSDAGRSNPSIMYMGDSVVMETWQAGLCSLARAGVEFLNACPSELGLVDIIGKNKVCFRHPRVNGTAALAAHSDQGFAKDKWKAAIYGCRDREKCTIDSSDNHRWDVILPNLGVHYNVNANRDIINHNNGKSVYKDDVGDLLQFMIDHARHRTRSREDFPTLHMFWGTSPQHFTTTLPGFWSTAYRDPYAGCTGTHPSREALQLNRIRSDVVWEVMIDKLADATGADCPEDVRVTDDPSYATTSATLKSACMSRVLDTCRGGVSHMEMDPFFRDRPEAHPGTRCARTFPAQLAADPTGELCDEGKYTTSDCTHHCWGPLLFQPIWERLEIAVKFHLDKCEV